MLFTAEYTIFERSDRVLGFGVTVVSGAAAVGIANGFQEVLLAVPTALALLFAYVFQLYGDALAFGAARRRLEEVLAQQLEAPALIYESNAAPVIHDPGSNRSVRLGLAVYGGLLGGSGAVGFVIVMAHGVLALVVYSVFTLASGAAAAVSFRDLGLLQSQVRDAVATWGDSS